ncbi:aldehyde dehydrogenase (NAD+) [Nitrosomonas communis]|uniref:Aldehyde dehydrogenase (NAD+) n=1 Tax=Nitrosomonas communis TaxID=44574 RepID=A0A5D3Y8Q1_9PROT|nr:aldehyde dehydrogenase (NAD+) [Nitrosomonas communis]
MSWIIHESGGTRSKANLEWTAVHGVLLEATTLSYLVEGRLLPADIPGKESRIYRKPVGVVGVVSPWNWPFQLTARLQHLHWPLVTLLLWSSQPMTHP